MTVAIGFRGRNRFFVDRYVERLRRLWAALPNDRPRLLEKIANVGSNNWYGYFAELAAWDLFSSLPLRLAIEVNPPGPQLGTNPSTLDGRLGALYDLHFDVKALADTTTMVLDGVKEELEARYPGVTLRFSHPLDLDQTTVSDVRQDLVDSICEAIVKDVSYVKHLASHVDVHIFRPPPSVTTTEHGYNPYRQAEHLRYSVLKDAHQFVRNAPNLVVFVMHPWFNFTNASDIVDLKGTFFRALARRAFCQLTTETQSLAAVLGRAPAGVSVKDAAKHLSGIAFVVDHSVKRRPRRDPTQVQGVLEAFVFANPNAAKTSDGRLQLERLVAEGSQLISLYDEFRFDNY